MALTFAAGQIITADALNASAPLYAAKLALQTVTNSTTLVNDTALFLDMSAGRTYDVTAMLAVSGATAGDIKIAWATTGTIFLLGQRACLGPTLLVADRLATTVTMPGGGGLTAQAYGVEPNIAIIMERLLVSCSVAGRLTLQWAQNTLSATGTNMWNTSFLTAHPVS